MRLVLATGNAGKAAEIAVLLGGVPGLELLPRPGGVPEPVEDGDTLLDNARIKARALLAATGEAAVADDTGLEVDGLDGAPGVQTARYAGEDATYDDNIAKLLRELGDADDRRAMWRTVALVAWPDGSETWTEGTCTGEITRARRGGAGFGYDPIFVADGGDGRTFAELSVAEKNAVSHRGRAFRALATILGSTGPR
ncbi:MAG: RdgB/HAM1 family non-canonical purine NTP pyrophosphatase [Acidimicrobiia bacterium]